MEDQVITEQEKVVLCEERIEYSFNEKQYLVAALTHSSVATSRLSSNERLEFLGDSILGFAICNWLYHKHPEYLEGELTQIKSEVVSRKVCAKVSRRLGLEQCLIVGRGVQQSNGLPKSLLSDVYEAIIAAIFLDGGFAAAEQFVLRTLEKELASAVEGHNMGNFKSALQQLAQRVHGAAPSYRLLTEQGPDHNKLFQVTAMVRKTKFTPAWGRTKKDAEQRAAGNALAELDGKPPPYAEALDHSM